ncbi:cobalt-zinc-cadmium efflux system membrane fusion protein [Myroides gitamensis]|uniref:Cation efflux system protein CzcB n=1 Tax=Myroides odoratus TaxID=256 RepID=A0A378RP29_MYROD|nr:efflux RND transporter periplasmic adaptor subunit [Myroides odoratus]MCS4239037.1 cobalt-zinc-cadmium efflux system membrane fusion protein [Myroides odoratus]MDH6599704.1 cobalt-zinc-cadmium efflux system membrane fusion protein [Myroides gitamensis]QQU04453.1 efflux RND transporter periplasmic adaptor subunit [Myroides odoratus]STZ28119.1 Cation efflux system protein CzcB [Myroides odoratus]
MKSIKTFSKHTIGYAVLAALTLSACKQQEVAPQAQDSYCIPEEIGKGLNFAKVTQRPIQRTMSLNGTVEYNQDKTIPFYSLVEGIVVSAKFSLGDFVKKGQLLAEIRSTDLNEFKTELRATEAELKVAKRELESVSSMYQDGISSQKELLEAEEDVQVLESKLRSAKSNLSMFNGQNKEGIYQIIAPQDGYIVTKSIVTGMTITDTDEPLFTIANLNDVWILANVYATSMRYVNLNAEVQVSTLAYPDEKFKGHISNISQVFDAEERVLKARIVLNNHEMKLRPGMSAEIHLLIDDNQGEALAVPNNAIIFDNNQNYVVVYQDKCHQEIRQITPLTKNQEYTYIQGGVQEGETVITTNELLIYEQLNNHL